MKLHLFVVCRKSKCVVRVIRNTMAYIKGNNYNYTISINYCFAWSPCH